MSEYDGPRTKFHALLQEQIFNEFAGAQQYVAIAVYFDGADLAAISETFLQPSGRGTKPRDDAGATSD